MTSVENIDGFEGPEVALESKTLTGLVRADKLSVKHILRAVKRAGSQYDARLLITSGAKPSPEALDKFRSRAGKLGVRPVSEPDGDNRLCLVPIS
ncbi:MAG: hypothetical protein H0W86_05560, partial [Armatimonadetes bacterium]|nr:hypothetical protein [Armatimonadota bacterium]